MNITKEFKMSFRAAYVNYYFYLFFSIIILKISINCSWYFYVSEQAHVSILVRLVMVLECFWQKKYFSAFKLFKIEFFKTLVLLYWFCSEWFYLNNQFYKAFIRIMSVKISFCVNHLQNVPLSHSFLFNYSTCYMFLLLLLLFMCL